MNGKPGIKLNGWIVVALAVSAALWALLCGGAAKVLGTG